MDDRLYRSATDRSIAGVAGGLAAWLGIDPSLVRVAWVLLAILSGGVFVVIYVVMMIVVPLAPPGWTPRRSAGGGGAPGAGTAPGGEGWAGAPGGWSSAAPSWPPDRERRPTEGDRARGAEGVGIAVGAFLVLLGGWLLIRPYLDIDWALIWPVAVIALGAALIIGAASRSR